MSKECANCGNERIMLCPFCEHDYTDQSTLTTLRAQLAEAERHIKETEKVRKLACKVIVDISAQLAEAERQRDEALGYVVAVALGIEHSTACTPETPCVRCERDARDKTIGELREECRAWRAWCKDIRSDLERALRRETISADTPCVRRVEAACAAVDASGAMGEKQ